jgi:hypothetical protein
LKYSQVRPSSEFWERPWLAGQVLLGNRRVVGSNKRWAQAREFQGTNGFPRADRDLTEGLGAE